MLRIILGVPTFILSALIVFVLSFILFPFLNTPVERLTNPPFPAGVDSWLLLVLLVSIPRLLWALFFSLSIIFLFKLIFSKLIFNKEFIFLVLIIQSAFFILVFPKSILFVLKEPPPSTNKVVYTSAPLKFPDVRGYTSVRFYTDAEKNQILSFYESKGLFKVGDLDEEKWLNPSLIPPDEKFPLVFYDFPSGGRFSLSSRGGKTSVTFYKSD